MKNQYLWMKIIFCKIIGLYLALKLKYNNIILLNNPKKNKKQLIILIENDK